MEDSNWVSIKQIPNFPVQKVRTISRSKKEDFGHVSLKQILSPPMKHLQDV